MNCKIAGRLLAVVCVCLSSPQIHASEDGGTASAPKLFSFLGEALKRPPSSEASSSAAASAAEVAAETESQSSKSAEEPTGEPARAEIKIGKFFEKLAAAPGEAIANAVDGSSSAVEAKTAPAPNPVSKTAATERPESLLSSFAKLFEGGETQAPADADTAPRTEIASTARPEAQTREQPKPKATPPASPLSMSGSVTVRTTAYTHSEADHLEWGLQTASGSLLRRTVEYTSAAADWSRFPLGTVFKIKGSSRIYVIDDYGRALVGSNTIDFYKTTIATMNEWGVRTVEIEIIKKGCFEKSKAILEGRRHVAHCARMYRSLLDI